MITLPDIELAFDTVEGERRTVSAFRNLFTGNGSPEDAGIVLVHLAIEARYYNTVPIETPSEQVKAIEHRRALFQIIVEATGLDLTELRAAVDRTEGSIE